MKYSVNFTHFVCALRFVQLCKSDDIDSWSPFGVITKVKTASATSVWLLHVWNGIQTALQSAPIYTEGSTDNKW